MLLLIPLSLCPLIYVLSTEKYAFGHYPDPEDNRRYWSRMQVALAFPLAAVLGIVVVALTHA